MWLLNTSTIELESFEGKKPKYAILSHRWEEQESSFDDVQNKRGREKKGYNKILNCCSQALKDGFKYTWIDTCCIDKRSSAELSEAINSMFRWYKDAEVCYAYLSDVASGDDLERSQWFTRGWTLQELLAPHHLIFYNRRWVSIGSKMELTKVINRVTGISTAALEDLDKDSSCIAARMNWAAGRQTTREEDRAYSLLGLFGVNMPLLYGEGDKAFLRLQEEITKYSKDPSIFAWSRDPHILFNLFAKSPDSFQTKRDFHVTKELTMEDLSFMGTSVYIETKRLFHVFNIYFIPLCFSYGRSASSSVTHGMFLQEDFGRNCFCRVTVDGEVLPTLPMITNIADKATTMKITRQQGELHDKSSNVYSFEDAKDRYEFSLTFHTFTLRPGELLSDDDNYFDTEDNSVARNLVKYFKGGHAIEENVMIAGNELNSPWPDRCLGITTNFAGIIIHFGQTSRGQTKVLLSKIHTGSERRHRDARVNTHGCSDFGCAVWRYPKPIGGSATAHPIWRPPSSRRLFTITDFCRIMLTSYDDELRACFLFVYPHEELNAQLPEAWRMTAAEAKSFAESAVQDSKVSDKLNLG